MNRLRYLLAMLGVGALLIASSVPTYAAINVFDSCTDVGNSDSAVCKAQGSSSATSIVQTIVNAAMLLLGSISVVMIILGGIKYTTSNGDQNQITSAKNTIMYSVIGLVVAILATAIVNFVVTQFIK